MTLKNIWNLDTKKKKKKKKIYSDTNEMNAWCFWLHVCKCRVVGLSKSLLRATPSFLLLVL